MHSETSATVCPGDILERRPGFRPRTVLTVVGRLVLAFVVAAVLWLHAGVEQGVAKAVARSTAWICERVWGPENTRHHVLSCYDAENHQLQFTSPAKAAEGVALVSLTATAYFSMLLPAVLILALPHMIFWQQVCRAALGSVIMLGVHLLYMPVYVPILFRIRLAEGARDGLLAWLDTFMFAMLFTILPVAVAGLGAVVRMPPLGLRLLRRALRGAAPAGEPERPLEAQSPARESRQAARRKVPRSRGRRRGRTGSRT